MFKTKTYFKVDEVFRSLQGEGTYAGALVTFVRFHGCDKNCSFCDTPDSKDPSGGPKGMTHEELLTQIHRVTGGFGVVVFTGGEPLLQLTPELLFELRSMGYILHLETHGDVESIIKYREERSKGMVPAGYIYGIMGLFNWVTVSPKHNVTQQDVALAGRSVKAYKVLFKLDKEGKAITTITSEAIELLARSGADLFLQPIWPAEPDLHTMIEAAADWIAEHGLMWRVGTQMHKVWGVK